MPKGKITVALAALLLAVSPGALAQTMVDDHTPARTFAGAYLAASAARADNDFRSASRYFDEALQFDRANNALQRELLVTLLTDGQFDQAMPYAQTLRDEPEIERVARLALGADAIRNGRYLEADTLLILSVENDLEVLITGIMRAWAKQGLGQTQAALELIDTLEGPEWFALFQNYHSALIADAGGLNEEAATRFADGSNDATGGRASPLTYLRLTGAYAKFEARNGRIDEAKSVIERGFAIAPTNPVLIDLATNIAAPENQEAEITSAADGAAEILLNIGSAVNRDGAEAFATLYLEIARALAPENAQLLFELGSTVEQLDLTEKAIDYYSLVPVRSPLHRVAALQQGLALSALDRNDEAKSTLLDLIGTNPEDYRGYMALGGVHSFLKEYQQAASAYEGARNVIDNNDPRYWTVHYRLGIAYERTGQWPKAEAAFLKALELSPDQPDVLNYLGYSWVDMNMNLERGLEMIRTAVSARPRDGYIVDSLGWAYYRLGRFDEAVTELEKAANLRAHDPTINDHLGDALWRVGRKLEATYQWSQALDMDGEDVDRDAIGAKIAAANTPGGVPQIAFSITDDENGEALAAVAPQAQTMTDAAETPAPDGTFEYVVRQGQSLWSIARDEMGDPEDGIEMILQLNPQLKNDPDAIAPGDRILLPAKVDG